MRATQRAQFAARPAEIVLSMCHANNRIFRCNPRFRQAVDAHLLEKTVQPRIIGAPNRLQLHPTTDGGNLSRVPPASASVGTAHRV
jgi:hypothetical protein